MQIIIQTPTAETMQQLFAALRKEKPLTPAVNIAIDIDPLNLL
jgi:primosomal protein N'